MTVRTTFTLTKAKGEDLFSRTPALSKRTLLRRFAAELLALAGGTGGGTGASDRTTIRYGTAAASATITCATVTNANTVTINGTALTATQKHARGTITPTLSGIDVADTVTINTTGILTARKHHSTGTVTITIANTDIADTVTINGSVFAAAAAEDTEAAEFDISGTATAAATSLVACIAASVDPLIAGIVTATSAAGVVTIRMVATGTGTVALLTSDADGLAISGATLTAGTVPATNEFDFSGSTAQCCTSLAAAINNCVQLSGLVTAWASATVVTVRAVAAGSGGNYALVSSDAQLAVSAATLTGGASVANNVFDFGGTDTETATDLARAINASSTALISSQVTATSSGAVVTLTAEQSGLTGNDTTLVSSDGATLAVTGSGRLAGGTEAVITF
jgi:hypothetical protein